MPNRRMLRLVWKVLEWLLDAMADGLALRARVSADEVLTAAREAVRLVISYRLEKHTVTKTQLESRNIYTGTISLTWSAPDSFSLRVKGTEEEEEQELELIGVDGRIFARQSTTGNIWAEFETDPNPDDKVAMEIVSMAKEFSAAPDFVPTMDEAELVGKEFIDGLSVYHIKGATRDKQALPENNHNGVWDDVPLQESDSTFHLYVGLGDFLPRRLLTETSLRWETSSGEAPGGEGTGYEPVYIESTDNFLDYNDPATFDVPAVH